MERVKLPSGMTALKMGDSLYVPVDERILWMEKNQIDYELSTNIQFMEDGRVFVTAHLVLYYEDGVRKFCAHSSGKVTVGDTYMGENAIVETVETSAWGRVFTAAGIGVTGEGPVMASLEEAAKSEGVEKLVAGDGKKKANATLRQAVKLAQKNG